MKPSRQYVGRLAPSPTGALHLGNVRTFMIAYLRARSLGGRLVMRMEDLDHPRDKPGAAMGAIDDLRWLGFEWDGYFVQSERKALYAAAAAKLHREGKIYPCICSRRDVEAAQSAPHAGEQLYYPGICRGRFDGWVEASKALAAEGGRRVPCWRFKVPEATQVEFEDVFAGRFSLDVAGKLGDFPVARDEGGAGYTLAVVVDDAAMGVTEVVRGDDLLPATPAQILLQQALGLPSVDYFHVPLVIGADGMRLAKRHGVTKISSFRAAGVRAEKIIGLLAASCGWCDWNEEVRLQELVSVFTPNSIPHTPFSIANFPFPI